MSAAKINDGGPAFPANDAQHAHAIACAAEDMFTGTNEERERVYIKARGEAMRGMSLRDYFAAHANADDVLAALDDLGRSGGLSQASTCMERNAIARYAHADAMIKARSAS